MNKLAVGILCFALGGATGFFIAKKLLEKKYIDIANEEIESVKESFRNEDQPEEEETVQDRIVKNPSSPLVRSSLYGTQTNEYNNIKNKYNLNKKLVFEEDVDITEEDEDDRIKDAAGMTEEEEMDLTEVNRTEPYVINSREFYEEFDHHDKLSLTYYIIDDVLCDDGEDIVDDIEKTVSQRALNLLSTSQGTIWVRNEPLGIDYEITGINRSYAEDVHGIIAEETPREKYVRTAKRKENDDE